MNVPLFTWCCTAILFLVVLAFKFYHRVVGNGHRPRHKLINVGREWEEIYVPGDRLIKNDYDYDEFDDM